MHNLQTPILEYETARRTPIPPAALSLLVGGAILFLVPLVAAAFVDALFVDLMPLLLAALGRKVWRGSRRAGIGALVLAGAYGVVGVALLAYSGVPTWGGRPSGARSLLPSVLAAVIAVWSLATAFLLTRWLWPPSDPSGRRYRRLTVWSLVSLYVCAGGGIGLRQSRYAQAVKNAPALTTDVEAVDADTRTPLPTAVGGPAIGRSDPWSASYSATGANRMRIRWKAVKPFPLRVSSPGYAEQEILLHTDVGAVTTARLRRLSSDVREP